MRKFNKARQFVDSTKKISEVGFEKDEKVFMCIWGVGYHGCDKVAKVEHCHLDFFTSDMGYEDHEITMIKELEIGQNIELLSSGNHTIVRMQ